MLIPVLESTSSSNEKLLFRCNIAERSSRFQMVWDELTDFQREHHRLVLQVGALQLPIDDVSPQTNQAEIAAGTASWHTGRATHELSGESEEEETLTVSSDEEDLSLDNSPSISDPPSSTTDNESVVHVLTIVTTIEEALTPAVESNELPLLLIVPTGMPRFEIKCTLGILCVSSRQKWLLHTAVSDVPTLYTLRFTDHTRTECTYTLNSTVLLEQLNLGKRLISRDPLFEMIKEQKQLQVNLQNGMNINRVMANHRLLRMQTSEPMTKLVEPLKSDLQWSFQLSTPLYRLDPALWMHLSEKRFFSCPLDDRYASSAANFFGKEYVDSAPITKIFRGKWLSSPLGNRSLASDYALSLAHHPSAKILVISKSNREFGWRNRLQARGDVQFVCWETLSPPATLGPHESYDGHYRQIVGESSLVNMEGNITPSQPSSSMYIDLLRHPWKLIIVDDIVGGLAYCQKAFSEQTSSEHQQLIPNPDVYLHQLPLYHFIRHLQSDEILCIADDYQARDPLSLLQIADLLQIHGRSSLMYSSLSCGTRDENNNTLLTINSTLGKFVSRHLIVQSSRSKFEKAMTSKIQTSLILIEPTLYEQMARPDMMNRYTKDASLSEFDQIPSETMASILIFPHPARLEAHRSYYESKEVFNLSNAHQCLMEQMAKKTAHGLPLLSRNGIVRNTHATGTNNNYQLNLFRDAQSLAVNFECAFCMQTEPSYSPNDHTISSCGHFACWSCLSAWRQHQRYTNDNVDLAVPCTTCRQPLSDYNHDIIRYCKTENVGVSPDMQMTRVTRKRRRISLRSFEEDKRSLQETGAKVQKLIQLLRQKDQHHRKTVLFTHHKSVSIELGNYLHRVNIKAARYIGTRKERADIAHRFQLPSGSLRVLILTTSFGFDDLDLAQTVDNLIMIDNCYNNVEEQESVENKLLQHIHNATRLKDLHIFRLILKESREEAKHTAFTQYIESF